MKKILVFVVVAALIAAACGSDKTETSTAGEPDMTNQSASSLVGEWTVTSIDGNAADVEPAPTLVVGADGSLGGNASCNSYSVTYAATDESFTFTGAPAITLMACDPATDAQERAFLQAFNSIAGNDGATFVIDGDTLTITTASATIKAAR